MGASNKHTKGNINNNNYKQKRAANLLLSLSLSLPNKQTNTKLAKRSRKAKLPGVFGCKTCGRQFLSFQALGGHMTSHLRPRIRSEGLSLVIGGTKFKEANKRHVCNLCGKEFKSGQALGGHKRLHRRHPDLVMASYNTSCDYRGEDGIDLNVPPLEMDNSCMFA